MPRIQRTGLDILCQSRGNAHIFLVIPGIGVIFNPVILAIVIGIQSHSRFGIPIQVNRLYLRDNDPARQISKRILVLGLITIVGVLTDLSESVFPLTIWVYIT